MNYQKIYNDLITKAQSENRNKKDSYFEQHHILPRSMGGSDEKNNLVLLTTREHYIAHALLYHIYKNSQMAYAWNMMSKSSNCHKEGRYINSRLHAIAKAEYIKHLKEDFKLEKNPFYGKTHTKETRKKISDMVKQHYKNNPEMLTELSNRAKKTFTGKAKSNEQKEKMSKSAKYRLSLINTVTNEKINIKTWERNLYSKSIWLNFYKNSRMNKEILIEIECPHCGKKSDKGNSSFMAWHFNNCKNKLGYQKLRKPGGVKKECWSPWDSPKNYDNNLKDLYRLLPDIEIFIINNTFKSEKAKNLALKKHIPKLSNFANHQIHGVIKALKDNKFNEQSKKSWNKFYNNKA